MTQSGIQRVEITVNGFRVFVGICIPNLLDREKISFFCIDFFRKSASSTCENHLALRKNDRNSFEIGRFISLFRVASIPDTGGHIFIAQPSRSKTYEYANLTVIPIIILFVKTRCNFASRNEKAIRSIFI